MTYREESLERRARLVRLLAQEPLESSAREAIEAEIAAGDRARREAARVRLPMVARARIASPCTEVWEAMIGEGAVRACARCDKEVFDVGQMMLATAERFLHSRAAQQGACVRLHRRADGTMLFADCEVGASGVRRRRFGAAVAALTLGATAALAANARPMRHSTHHQARVARAHPREADPRDAETRPGVRFVPFYETPEGRAQLNAILQMGGLGTFEH